MPEQTVPVNTAHERAGSDIPYAPALLGSLTGACFVGMVTGSLRIENSEAVLSEFADAIDESDPDARVSSLMPVVEQQEAKIEQVQTETLLAGAGFVFFGAAAAVTTYLAVRKRDRQRTKTQGAPNE